jgi:hypothetical protein
LQRASRWATIAPLSSHTEVDIAAVAAKDGKGVGKDGKVPGGGYDVSRPGGKCAITGAVIAPGEKFHAALRETASTIERLDIADAAWPDFPKDGLLASWRATMPVGETKKKVFVDDEVLLTLFERLADAAEPTKLRFRFVLGLILMRKRLISYEGEEERGGASLWKVKLKGREDAIDLVNPHLSESQVDEVASQVGEILNSEL